MNNSLLSIEIDDLYPIEDKVKYREKETELVKIIDALQKIAESEEWKVLSEKVFNGVVETLKRQREEEIEKQPLNGPKIHNLNGQIKWAKKYLNITELANVYKLELGNIRKHLNAT